MRMTAMLYCATVVALSALVYGCHKTATGNGHGHSGEEKSEEHPQHEETITYKEGKGLHVPQKTARIIGLRTQDVTERELASVARFEARVYRTSSEARFVSLEPVALPMALASGRLNARQGSALTPGNRVSVTTRSGSELSAEVGQIKEFGKAQEHIEVLLAIKDAKEELEQGEFVTASVTSEARKASATVPKSAVLTTAEGKFVYTVSGEHLVRTPVVIGITNAEAVEVTDGLYAGDEVVAEGVTTLWMAELQAIRGGASCADGH